MKNGYFMGDVCGIKDANGIKFGLGNLYEISENMYNAVKRGASLGACIKNVQKTRSFSNRNYSVVEYLTGNTFNRGDGMSVALRNADDAEYNEKPKTVKLIKRLPIKNFYELVPIFFQDTLKEKIILLIFTLYFFFQSKFDKNLLKTT